MIKLQSVPVIALISTLYIPIYGRLRDEKFFVSPGCTALLLKLLEVVIVTVDDVDELADAEVPRVPLAVVLVSM